MAYDSGDSLERYERGPIEVRAGDHLQFFLRMTRSAEWMEFFRKARGIPPAEEEGLELGDELVRVRYGTRTESPGSVTYGGYWFELTYQTLTLAGGDVTCTTPLTRCEGGPGTVVELARTGEILSGARVEVDFKEKGGTDRRYPHIRAQTVNHFGDVYSAQGMSQGYEALDQIRDDNLSAGCDKILGELVASQRPTANGYSWVNDVDDLKDAMAAIANNIYNKKLLYDGVTSTMTPQEVGSQLQYSCFLLFTCVASSVGEFFQNASVVMGLSANSSDAIWVRSSLINIQEGKRILAGTVMHEVLHKLGYKDNTVTGDEVALWSYSGMRLKECF